MPMLHSLSNYNRANDVACCVCGNRLLSRLMMSPSLKSQVTFASAFIGDFFRIFGINSFLTYGQFVEYYEYACNELMQ